MVPPGYGREEGGIYTTLGIPPWCIYHCYTLGIPSLVYIPLLHTLGMRGEQSAQSHPL